MHGVEPFDDVVCLADVAVVVRRRDQNAMVSQLGKVAPKTFHQSTGAGCGGQAGQLLWEEYSIEVILVSHSKLLKLEITLCHKEGQASKLSHFLRVKREFFSEFCFVGDVAESKLDELWLCKVAFDFTLLLRQDVTHHESLALLCAEVNQEGVDQLDQASRAHKPKPILLDFHDLIFGSFLGDKVAQLKLTDLAQFKNGLKAGRLVALGQDTVLVPQQGHDLVITSLCRCHFKECVRALEDGSLLGFFLGYSG